MSINLVRSPVYAMTCDADDCGAELRSKWDDYLRREAESAGWQIRPRRGKGSRTLPDLCPEHRTESGEAVTR